MLYKIKARKQLMTTLKTISRNNYDKDYSKISKKIPKMSFDQKTPDQRRCISQKKKQKITKSQDSNNNQIFIDKWLSKTLLSAKWSLCWSSPLPIVSEFEDKRSHTKFKLTITSIPSNDNYKFSVFALNKEIIDDLICINYEIFEGKTLKSLHKSTFSQRNNITSSQRLPSELVNYENIIISISISTESINYIIPYKGLTNQGSTCYMNSVIQMLYMIPYFKNKILSYKTDSIENNQKNLNSLQNLFKEMGAKNCNIKEISTLPLINSFGWNQSQVEIQYDIWEFLINLRDILTQQIPTKWKNDKKSNIFNYWFDGNVLTTIFCKNAKFMSSKTESFSEIQLPIENCTDIYDCLKKYTEIEEWTGENQYYVNETVKKQNAIKYIKFETLPKVLLLQLKRFCYDSKNGRMVKINDYIKFDKDLDWKDFLSSANSGSQLESKYTWYCVIVHSGTIDSGHYYSFIKDPSEEWYLFNDESVTRVNYYEVFDNNYGGNITYYWLNKKRKNHEIKENVIENSSNAYLLMYVRNDCVTKLMKNKSKTDETITDSNSTTNTEITKFTNNTCPSPFSLRSWTLNWFTEDCWLNQKAIGWMNIDLQKFCVIRVESTWTIKELYLLLLKKNNQDLDLISWYVYIQLSNDNFSLIKLEKESDSKLTSAIGDRDYDNLYIFCKPLCNGFELIIEDEYKDGITFNKNISQKMSVFTPVTLNNRTTQLLVFKYPSVTLNRNKEIYTELVIDSILEVDSNTSLNKIISKKHVKEKYMKLYSNSSMKEYNINENDISFWAEKSSISRTNDEKEEHTYPIKFHNSFWMFNSQCVIIIINIIFISPSGDKISTKESINTFLEKKINYEIKYITDNMFGQEKTMVEIKKKIINTPNSVAIKQEIIKSIENRKHVHYVNKTCSRVMLKPDHLIYTLNQEEKIIHYSFKTSVEYTVKKIIINKVNKEQSENINVFCEWNNLVHTHSFTNLFEYLNNQYDLHEYTTCLLCFNPKSYVIYCSLDWTNNSEERFSYEVQGLRYKNIEYEFIYQCQPKETNNLELSKQIFVSFYYKSTNSETTPFSLPFALLKSKSNLEVNEIYNDIESIFNLKKYNFSLFLGEIQSNSMMKGEEMRRNFDEKRLSNFFFADNEAVAIYAEVEAIKDEFLEESLM